LIACSLSFEHAANGNSGDSKALKSAWMGEFLVTVALFFDQQLPNLFPRDARIQKRRLELGIGLALGVDQGANRCFESRW
jgi:hypothetical protein